MNMKKTNRATALLLLPAALVLGATTACTTPTVNTVESATPKARVTPEQMRHFKTDRALDRVARPVFLQTGKGADGQSLKVQAQVQNTTRKTAVFHYRVNWFDAQGLALSGYTPAMHTVELSGGEIKSITVTAPSSAAVDFQIVFIEPR